MREKEHRVPRLQAEGIGMVNQAREAAIEGFK
jgi:hypothetical protein